MSDTSYSKIINNGLWVNNPAFVQLLGLCPLLAVSNTVINGLGLGLATTITLVASNVMVSLIRHWVRPEIRIPVFVLIIASTVTVIELSMNAWFHELYNILGIFIPLIVVNCIVLGRAEAFASKNSIVKSIADALGMGVGFTLALVALGLTREFLANGTLFTVQFVPGWTESFMLTISSPGAFIILGLFLAGMNYLNMRNAKKKGRAFVVPKHLGCRHCNMCNILHGED